MKIVIVAAAAALFLAGCTTNNKPPVIIDNSTVVVISPPESLFYCPQAGPPPKADTLTNREIAEYVAKLYKYQKICGLNMRKIKQYIDSAKKDIQLPEEG